MLRSILFVLSFFLVNVLAFSQARQYNFSSLDIEDGLSHNQIISIFKDDVGFMWFGTMSGLNRYDGYKYKIFKHSQHDTSSIIDDYISKIVPGPADKM